MLHHCTFIQILNFSGDFNNYYVSRSLYLGHILCHLYITEFVICRTLQQVAQKREQKNANVRAHCVAYPDTNQCRKFLGKARRKLILYRFAIIPITLQMWQHDEGCLKLTNSRNSFKTDLSDLVIQNAWFYSALCAGIYRQTSINTNRGRVCGKDSFPRARVGTNQHKKKHTVGQGLKNRCFCTIRKNSIYEKKTVQVSGIFVSRSSILPRVLLFTDKRKWFYFIYLKE